MARNSHLVPALVAAFFVGAAVASRADEPSPAAPPAAAHASHGGEIVAFADGDARYEIVLDSMSGTVTAYGLPSGADGSPAGTPPIVVLDNDRRIRLVALRGVANAWAARDDAFRANEVSARLHVRLDGKGLEAPLRLSAKAVPVVPTTYVEPQPSRGGRILSLCGASFEAVHDRAAGTLSLHAVKDPSRPYAIDGPPTFSLDTASGSREIALAPIEGMPDSWSANADALKAAAVSGSFHVKVDGLPCQAVWASSTPSAERRLVVGEGIAQLRMVHDPKLGTLTFHRLDLSPKAAVFESPEVVLRWETGPRTYALTRLEGESGEGWTVTDPSLRTGAALKGTFRVKIEGRVQEASLPATAWADSDAVLLTFGDGAVRLKAMLDAGAGRLWLDAMGVGTAVALDEPPVVVLHDLPGAGEKELTLKAETSEFGGWSVRADRLKDVTSLDATIRVKVAGRSYEASLRRPAAPPVKSDSDSGAGGEVR